MFNKSIILLVQNELIKFFTKKIIFYILIVMAIGVFGFALNLKSTTEGLDFTKWKEIVQKDIEDKRNSLNNSNVGMTDGMKSTIMQSIKVEEYMVANNIEPIRKKSVSNFVLSLNNMFALIIILGIIIAGTIMSDEYSKGTINLLMTLPFKRWKILLSKLITIGIISILTIVILYILSIVEGWLFFGFDGMNKQIVTYVEGQIILRNVLVQSLYLNFYNLFTLIACTTLTLFLTLLFKNGIVGTCSSIILYYGGTQVAIALREYSFIKYSLFANIHFQMYFNGVELFKGVTKEFSLTVICAYVALFCTLSFLLFRKRNVYE